MNNIVKVGNDYPDWTLATKAHRCKPGHDPIDTSPADV